MLLFRQYYSKGGLAQLQGVEVLFIILTRIPVRFCTPLPPHLSSPVIVQYLYIGPDTVQSAQWHCMDSVCVKGTDCFLIGYLSVDSTVADLDIMTMADQTGGHKQSWSSTLCGRLYSEPVIRRSTVTFLRWRHQRRSRSGLGTCGRTPLWTITTT